MPTADATATTSQRAILHVDMDAFYVSVELRRHPELRGTPVVVGYDGPRGVVAAASYEARAHGVHSAMASVHARRQCPGLTFLPGDHALYGAVSAELYEIFHSVTPLVEPVSVDEAFLDVTGSQRLMGTPTVIAQHIRVAVFNELKLTCSVGVATSKFIAKLASEAAKPRASVNGPIFGPGVFEVPTGGELAFLHPLPVKVLWGVGPATLARLERIGINRVADLAAAPVNVVTAAVGKAAGAHLHALANGIDSRPVVPQRQTKSIGHEETFNRDLYTHEEIRAELVRLCDSVGSRLRRNEVAAKTIQLKLKFADFQLVTRSKTVDQPLATGPEILRVVSVLLEGVDVSKGVRLVGVSGAGFGVASSEQLELDIFAASPGSTPDVTSTGEGTRVAATGADWQAASVAIDEVRERFGTAAIGPARNSKATRSLPTHSP